MKTPEMFLTLSPQIDCRKALNLQCNNPYYKKIQIQLEGLKELS